MKKIVILTSLLALTACGGGSGGGAIGGGTAKEINADVDVDNDFWSTGK